MQVINFAENVKNALKFQKYEIYENFKIDNFRISTSKQS